MTIPKIHWTPEKLRAVIMACREGIIKKKSRTPAQAEEANICSPDCPLYEYEAQNPCRSGAEGCTAILSIPDALCEAELNDREWYEGTMSYEDLDKLIDYLIEDKMDPLYADLCKVKEMQNEENTDA